MTPAQLDAHDAALLARIHASMKRWELLADDRPVSAALAAGAAAGWAVLAYLSGTLEREAERIAARERGEFERSTGARMRVET